MRLFLLLLIACSLSQGQVPQDNRPNQKTGSGNQSKDSESHKPSTVDHSEAQPASNAENHDHSHNSEPKIYPVKIVSQPTDGWYIAYVLVTILLAFVGIGTLSVIWRQTNHIEKQVDALVKAECAWIMTSVEFTADVGGKHATHMKETLGAGEEVSLLIELICTNDGRAPAWIDKIWVWLKFVPDLPEIPDRDSPSRSMIGPFPIFVGSTEPFHFQPSYEGRRTGVGGIPQVLYALVVYRDAFGEGHETWCGYYVKGPLDAPHLERIAGFPKYNANI